MGWGQYNDDNQRLRIEKTWTRICLSYCFVLRTGDPTKMAKLVGGTWDEQEFYRRFGIKGCGGMLGTALHVADETSCSQGTIDVTKDWHGRTLASPVSMTISCCDQQGGCTTSGTSSVYRRRLSFVLMSLLTALFVRRGYIIF